jgi:hypothetical protein
MVQANVGHNVTPKGCFVVLVYTVYTGLGGDWGGQY